MKTGNKNRSHLALTFWLIGIAALIMLLPTDVLLKDLFEDSFLAEYTGLFAKMLIVFLIGNYALNRLHIRPLAGLSKQYPWKYKYLNLIPVYLMILGTLSVLSKDLSVISIGNVLLLLFACLTVGFAEEFVFRGVLQSLLMRRFVTQKKGVFISVLLSSLIFGLFHLINLYKNDTAEVLIQVVYAAFTGFFFGAVLLKTNKLIPIAIVHGFINFFFSLQLLPGIALEQETVNSVSIAPIIVFLPLFIVGLFIIRKLDEQNIIQKINQ